jgi:hypothetical protein
MTPGFMRWLLRADTIRQPIDIATASGNDVLAALLCEESLLRAEIVPPLPNRERPQLIIETTCRARERAGACGSRRRDRVKDIASRA